MERREFLASAAALAAATWLVACGDDDEEDNGSSGDCNANGTNATIGTNHGHTLTVSRADVTAAVDKTYDIRGTSTHKHDVTVTAADFAELANNESVTITSTTEAGHSHVVTVVCA